MNRIQTIFLALGLLLPFSAKSADPINTATIMLDPAVLAEILKDPKVRQIFTQALQAAKDSSSFKKNLVHTGKGFAQGFKGIAIGTSRLLLDCSEQFGKLGKAAAEHYWILGGVLTASGLFYWYILPKISVEVKFNSDRNRPAQIYVAR